MQGRRPVRGLMARPKTTPLDRSLARFLRKQRGKMTFAEFSKHTGLMPSNLFRLENGQQSITLKMLHRVLKRLRCSMKDVFSGRRECAARISTARFTFASVIEHEAVTLSES